MWVQDIEELKMKTLAIEYGIFKSIQNKDMVSYYFYGELYKKLALQCLEMTLEWR